MQRSFITEKQENNLEVQLVKEGSAVATRKESEINTFDKSPRASPTPKHHQTQISCSSSGNCTVKDGEDVVTYTDFDSMGLSDELLRGIYAYGYEKPSVVQQRAIVPCTTGRDVVAQAQSGTGKTATFSISVLQQLDMEKKYCQVHGSIPQSIFAFMFYSI